MPVGNPQRHATSAALTAWVLLLAGCVATETHAPPISTTAIRAAARRGIDPDSLAAGRQILLTRCSSCHALEPVSDYTAAEWERIVINMAPRSKLTAAETTALDNYLAVVSSGPTP